jgi:hypothetical protein
VRTGDDVVVIVAPWEPDRGDWAALLKGCTMRPAQQFGDLRKNFGRLVSSFLEEGIADDTRWKNERIIVAT